MNDTPSPRDHPPDPTPHLSRPTLVLLVATVATPIVLTGGATMLDRPRR